MAEMLPNKKAVALGAMFVAIWETWSNFSEDAADDALRLCAESVVALDMTRVDGVIAAPLNYFARAYLHEENPEDLTYDEMIGSIDNSLAVLAGD